MSEDLSELQDLVIKATNNIRAFREDSKKLSSELSFKQKRVLERIDRMENPERYAGQTAEVINLSSHQKPKYPTPYKISKLNECQLNVLSFLSKEGRRPIDSIKAVFGLSDGDFTRLLNDGLIVYVDLNSIKQPLYTITSFGREVLNDMGGDK